MRELFARTICSLDCTRSCGQHYRKPIALPHHGAVGQGAPQALTAPTARRSGLSKAGRTSCANCVLCGTACKTTVIAMANEAAYRCLLRFDPNPIPPTSTPQRRRKHAWTCDVPLRAERRPGLRVFPATCALILPLLPIPSSAPPCHTFFSPVPPQSSSVLPPPTSSVLSPLPFCFLSTLSP